MPRENRVARFAVTPDFMIEIVKYGCDSAARIASNALPEDARFRGAYVDCGLIWFVVESETFAHVEEAAPIPILPQTTFKKVRLDGKTLQRALDVVNGNWDAWRNEVEFEHCDNVPHTDVVELIARIVTDIEAQPTEA